jgi:hypothetical protein
MSATVRAATPLLTHEHTMLVRLSAHNPFVQRKDVVPLAFAGTLRELDQALEVKLDYFSLGRSASDDAIKHELGSFFSFDKATLVVLIAKLTEQEPDNLYSILLSRGPFGNLFFSGRRAVQVTYLARHIQIGQWMIEEDSAMPFRLRNDGMRIFRPNRNS